MRKKIILTGGGTAGHVMPCLAIAEKLEGWDIHYIGRREGIERELAESRGITYHGIDCPRFVRNRPWTLFAVPFKLNKAKKDARRLITEIRPDVIFSKGGYVSLPVALAAGNVPVVLHESDRSFGLANKLAFKKCRTVCSSFPMEKEGVICTGSPLSGAIYNGNAETAKRQCGFNGDKPVLLVTGGSLGAKALNQAVEKDFAELTKRYDVIHITGKGYDYKPQKGYYPIPFTDRIHSFMKLADFAVTRGGGNTIFELAALGVPSVIVPLPKGASRGDQIENAEYFESKGYAIHADQSAVLDGGLMPQLKRLEEERIQIKRALANGEFDGSDKIAKIIRNAAK